jgi:hypothetical protein
MPTTSIDTFFACTIIVAAALIGTAFLASTMQTRIASTQDINKQSFLKAIADRLVTSSGTPSDWGQSSIVPGDFGLAASDSTSVYTLDPDKITRLNTQNTNSLSYFDLATSAKLSNIAVGITVSQILSIDIKQTSNSTQGSDTYFGFTVLTSVDSQPVNANLHYYLMANNYQAEAINNTSGVGISYISVEVPSTSIDNAMLIMFARASYDDRITSYAIYNFADGAQQSAPNCNNVVLSPLDNKLTIASNSSSVTFNGAYVFSFSNKENLIYAQGASHCAIPSLIDQSPLLIVVNGVNGDVYFQQWTAYPQVPLRAGSTFNGSEQNVFNYIVTINGVLYRLDVSLGDTPP